MNTDHLVMGLRRAGQPVRLTYKDGRNHEAYAVMQRLNVDEIKGKRQLKIKQDLFGFWVPPMDVEGIVQLSINGQSYQIVGHEQPALLVLYGIDVDEVHTVDEAERHSPWR